MSIEKRLYEAKRWVSTARDDMDTADILKEKGKFAHACFHSQQAGEKAIKAIWYFLDADPWGHSIQRLIEDLESVDGNVYQVLKKLIRRGMVLDRYYIPTRYPNGLPDITPDLAFSQEDADIGITYAREIISHVATILNLNKVTKLTETTKPSK